MSAPGNDKRTESVWQHVLGRGQSLAREAMGSEGVHKGTARGSEPVDLVRVLEAEVTHLRRGEVASGEDEHSGVVGVDRMSLEGARGDAVVFRDEEVAAIAPAPIHSSSRMRCARSSPYWSASV